MTKFVNIYPGGKTTVTDFGAYNQDSQYHPPGGVTERHIQGDDLRIIACRIMGRGSFPCGYGTLYVYQEGGAKWTMVM